MIQLHPATWIALWLCWLGAGQGGGWVAQGAWAGVSLLLAFPLAGKRVLRLLRRLRWLFVAIVITLGWGTPGRLLVPDLSMGPTLEGMREAGRASLHLAAMAACVAVLMQAMPLPRLAGGLHRLLNPLGDVAPGPDSFALRLQLVLAEIETAPHRRGWREWLGPAQAGDAPPVRVEHCPPLRRADHLVLCCGLFALVVWIGLRAA
ncbi:hypothetical protein [Methyloversatilis thermotolerans]|uniref:hypothetical protein n=1 Tax=Methyloversatilis thermotolerans TaxID=1346290 RepID=UPI0003739BFB|nr:hypothetical protein [Methyloversatilis thermotolerans]